MKDDKSDNLLIADTDTDFNNSRNEFDIDDNGSVVIKMQVQDTCSLFSTFGEDELSSEAAEYLYTKARYSNPVGKLSINIISPTPLDQETQQTIKRTVRQHFVFKSQRAKTHLKNDFLVGGLALLGAMLAMFAVLILQLNISDESSFVNIIFTVVIWFFIWQCAEKLIFSRAAHRIDKLLCYRLFSADIKFNHKRDSQ